MEYPFANYISEVSMEWDKTPDTQERIKFFTIRITVTYFNLTKSNECLKSNSDLLRV